MGLQLTAPVAQVAHTRDGAETRVMAAALARTPTWAEVKDRAKHQAAALHARHRHISPMGVSVVAIPGECELSSMELITYI
jgi:hypothetical protein